VAQPHRPAAPSTPSSTGYPGPSYTGVTEGLPASVTATNQQVAASGTGGGPGYGEPPYGQRRPGLGRQRWLVLGACALLGTAIGVGADRLPTGGSTPSAAPSPTPSATASVAATVTPFTTSGSSFTERDGGWRSQRYRDAQFGNLKKGIGLRLDLGSARPLTAVTFTAGSGPLTVELRAGDTPGNDGTAYALVGSAVQANGATTLPATTGGSHRYWVIWVTQLPSSSFQAQIDDVVARG
jgi:hypothetical protein